MNKDIYLKSYQTSDKKLWDTFIDESKNGVFLFKRDYMDYHSDRFKDQSLVILNNKDELIACFPANIDGDVIYSHQGLTYGGIIQSKKLKILEIIEIFKQIIAFYKKKHIKKIVYKSIPHIYHNYPSEEDSYALFRYNAKLIRRDISSTINLNRELLFSKRKKNYLNRLFANGINVLESKDTTCFFQLLSKLLNEKYNVSPTHTADEMNLLIHRFNENIKFFSINMDDSICTGIILYFNLKTIHVQYIAANDEAKKSNMLDMLFMYIIEKYKDDFDYLDFGISTEKNGMHLNEGLINFKERFGARGICYDQYELNL